MLLFCTILEAVRDRGMDGACIDDTSRLAGMAAVLGVFLHRMHAVNKVLLVVYPDVRIIVS